METEERDPKWTISSVKRTVVLDALEDAHGSIEADLVGVRDALRDLCADLEAAMRDVPERPRNDGGGADWERLGARSHRIERWLHRASRRIRAQYSMYHLAGRWRVLFRALAPDWRDGVRHKSMALNIEYAAGRAAKATRLLLLNGRSGAEEALGLLESIGTTLDETVLRRFREDDRVDDAIAFETFRDPAEKWGAKLEAYLELHD
jgi:hypothetical protein